MFGKDNKNARKIVVTPGMVEMGADHDKEHSRLGKIIAEKCDILKQPTERIESLVASFTKLHRQNLNQVSGF